jgi:hypothetical protein
MCVKLPEKLKKWFLLNCFLSITNSLTNPRVYLGSIMPKIEVLKTLSLGKVRFLHVAQELLFDIEVGLHNASHH